MAFESELSNVIYMHYISAFLILPFIFLADSQVLHQGARA